METKIIQLKLNLEYDEKNDGCYRNAEGELLPWEEPEYLKSLEKERQND